MTVVIAADADVIQHPKDHQHRSTVPGDAEQAARAAFRPVAEPHENRQGQHRDRHADFDKLHEQPRLVAVHEIVHDEAGQLERNRHDRAEGRLRDVIALVLRLVGAFEFRAVHSGLWASKNMFVPVGSARTMQSSLDACEGDRASISWELR
jgi:hypothetical protein